MAFRTISVRLTGNASSLNSALYQASRTIDRFGLSVGRSASGSLLRFGAGATIAGTAVYGLSRAFTASVRAAVQFDAAMRNVNSISGLTNRQLTELSGQVLDLSTQVPQSANNLANGLYQIASSGFQGAEGLQILEQSAIAASAGLTDTSVSAQAIVGAINAYGFAAGDATHVSDVLFQTVNVGVLSFADLAQGLGDVVGNAAAAKVPLEDVGAAVATMTKAGLVPAESFTSLNRLITAVIKPSENLAALLNQLGYESGSAALEQLGLQGVMEKVQAATGGQAAAVRALFNEERAARGALLLLSDSGRLYARTARAFNDETELQGRTLRTFREQMKSVSAQWELFKNQAAAAGIEAATTLLPAILQILDGLRELGGDVGPVVVATLDRLEPTFRALASIGLDLWTILGDLIAVATPAAQALAALGGGAVIATLNTLAGILAAVTDLAADHTTTIGILAALYLSRFVPALVAAARAAAINVFLALEAAVFGLASAATSGTASLRTMASGFTIASAAAAAFNITVTAGLAVLAVGLYRTQQAAASAREEIGRITEDFNPNNYQEASRTLEELEREINSNRAAFNEHNRFLRGASRAGIGPGTGDLQDAKEAQRQYELLAEQLLNTQTNAVRLGEELGISGNEVLAFVDANDIDLSKPWEESAAAIRAARRGLRDLANEAGLSLPKLSELAGGGVEAMKALAEQVEDTKDAVRKAFLGSFDVFANFHPEEAAEAEEAALEQVTAARQKLADARARDAKGEEEQRDRTRAITDATRDLRDAQAALGDAQQAGSLVAFYRNAEREATAFADNVEEAMRRGLDPEFVQRALVQGPEAAGPLLEQLVSDHSGRLIDMVNKSERALQRISKRVVEFARLTTLATQSETDALVNDLPLAMRIASEKFAQGADATVESIAKALGVKKSRIFDVGTEFGITFAGGVAQGAKNSKITIDPEVRAGQVRFKIEHLPGAASGGYITGPGGPRSDSIVARLSNGEYVQQARAVAYYGVDFMDRLNRLKVPRYATGGPVNVRADNPRVQTVIVQVDRPTQVTHSRPVHIDKVEAHDYDDFQRQLDRDARINGVMGLAGS